MGAAWRAIIPAAELPEFFQQGQKTKRESWEQTRTL